jgi:diacylglycerol kinase (ATP)
MESDLGLREFKMKKDTFSLKARVESFAHAIRGVRITLNSQHNAWIHAMASVVVTILGIYYRLTSWEWCWIIVAIVIVWTAEALNTSLEFLMDAATPDYHPLVEKAKDVAAGAVLIAAIGAAIIGLVILGPYFLRGLGLG